MEKLTFNRQFISLDLLGEEETSLWPSNASCILTFREECRSLDTGSAFYFQTTALKHVSQHPWDVFKHLELWVEPYCSSLLYTQAVNVTEAT